MGCNDRGFRSSKPGEEPQLTLQVDCPLECPSATRERTYVFTPRVSFLICYLNFCSLVFHCGNWKIKFFAENVHKKCRILSCSRRVHWCHVIAAVGEGSWLMLSG